LRRQDAFDFGFGQAMVTAGRFGRPDLPVMNPLFQGGIPDPQPFGGGADRQQGHIDTI